MYKNYNINQYNNKYIGPVGFRLLKPPSEWRNYLSGEVRKSNPGVLGFLKKKN